jgi:uncharacterized membrane-anchored protein YjiN (DUF445 family)
MKPIMRLSASLIPLCLLLTLGCASQQPAAPDSTTTAPRDRPSADERAARQAEQLTTRLQLDEDTAGRVEAILLKYAERNEALRRSGGDRRSQFGQLRENMDAQDGELREVLTAEQYAIYEELRDEQRARMREQLRQRRTRN